MKLRREIEEKLKNKNNLEHTYFNNYRDNTFDYIEDNDFHKEIISGKGSEIISKNRTPPKFCSISSSTALVINNFAPFKKMLNNEDFKIGRNKTFTSMVFEKGISNGLKGTNPQLDIYIEGNDYNLAIESKFLEITEKKNTKKLSMQYRNINDSRRDENWYNLLLDLDSGKKRYLYLDAIQLLKHIFGIQYKKIKRIKLLYMYWQPRNYKQYAEYLKHKEELLDFKREIMDCNVAFESLTYQELWDSWEKSESPFIKKHVQKLKMKYDLLL